MKKQQKTDSSFSKFIAFINEHEIGDIIQRKNLLRYSAYSHLDITEQTIDTYRSTLMGTYLKHTSKPGHYELIKKVPNISSTAIRTQRAEITKQNNLEKI